MILQITNFIEGGTFINHEPSKYEDDVIITSPEIFFEFKGDSSSLFVKSDNVEDAIEEIIPTLLIDEYFEYSYSFEDLGLPEPSYTNAEGESGTIRYVDSFLYERKNLDIPNENEVMDSLVEKARDLFPIEVIQ